AYHGWVTAYEMLLGYALAVAVAVPLAIAITSSQRFDSFVMPTLLFFQVVPKVAIAPLFLVWFGVGALPKVLVAFLISFFPIVIDAAVGLRSMSAEMRDLARSMGATRAQVFARFRLPTSLPYLFSGLKVAAALAIAAPLHAQPTTKFQFRLNWTLYGEHAPFFVARDKGFYRDEGLEVEIQEGSGSTTVAQLVANATSPVAYVDAATMMRGV